MVSASEIQHTRLKGELVFQDFCLKLIRRYWQDDYAEAHGRSGQRQHGADITGRDNRNGFKIAAVQCKASETDQPRQLTQKELLEEIEKAKGFRPKLDILIVAYGGDRDAVLRAKALELNAENEAAGLFKVALWSWDDIVQRALDFPEVAQELLVHNQVPVVPALDPKRPMGDASQSIQAIMQNAMAGLQAVVADTAANTGDPVLDAKLDVFRDQLRQGNGRMLVDSLRAFVADLPARTHPHVRFRAYSNLGSALVQADNIDGAIIAFDAAADAEPDSADGLTSRARAALMRGNNSAALAAAQAAMQLAPDRFAATLLLEAAPEGMDPASLEAEVSSFRAEVEVASSLARLYAVRGAHGDAIRVARGIAKDDWRKDGTLGQVLLAEFENNSSLKIGAPMSPAEQAQAEEARVRLDRAWNAAKARTDRHNWTSYGVNLSSACRLLGRDEEADQLVLEIFALDPKTQSIAQRAALAFTRRGELDKAQNALDELLLESREPEDLLLAATIAASRKDWSTATTLAEEVMENAALDDERARAAELLVQAKFRSDTPTDALVAAASLRSRFASTIGFESRVAEVARRLGDTGALDDARKRLEGFGSIATLDAMQRFELADAYADDGQWSKAADLLAGLHALDRPSEILKRRLFALYRADRRADARVLYQSLRPQALESSDILRMGAAVYERSGMLSEALASLASAVLRDPNDLRSRLDWVRLNLRNGNDAHVRKWAKKVVASESDGDAEDLMELAQVLDRYGSRRAAMSLGYRVLQEHWGASERLHMMYMSLFLMHSRAEPFLHPKTVTEDSVVFLRNEHGASADHKIERDGKQGPGILRPDQPFATLLIGKKKGDEVIPEAGIGQPTHWAITEIKHKYLDLLHRAMEAHATLFPQSRSLGQFHFDPGGEDRFEPMFEQARSRLRLVDDAVGLYVNQPIPMDAIARILGADAIDASRGLRFESRIVFDSCIGEHEERELAVQAILGGSQSFLVDALTLALWDEIGFLPELVRLGLKPIVVQSTIDTFVQRLDEAQRNAESKGGTLQAKGDQLVFIEVSKEERQAVVDGCQKLLDWVRAHTQLAPTESSPHALLDQAEELFSPSSHDTLATAVQTQTLLIVEDRRTRGFAGVVGATRLSWTQPLLLVMRSDGRLSPDRYVELLARMVEQCIGFVSIGANELAAAAALKDGSKTFAALCIAVTGKTVDPSSLVQVGSEFMTGVWTSGTGNPERQCSAILEGILRRADSLTLFLATVIAVDRNIRNRPFPDSLLATLWSAFVERFAIGHFIRDAAAALAKSSAMPNATEVLRNKKRG